MLHPLLRINLASGIMIAIVAGDASAGGGLSFQAAALSGQLAPGTGRNFNFFYPPSINDTGRVAFAAWLVGSNLNDESLWSGPPGAIQLVAREGSAAPGTPPGVAFVSGWLTPRINASGIVAFSAAIVGPGVNSTNNTGIWAGLPGALALVARAGSPAPGTPAGVVFSGGMQNWLMLNGAGQVVFRANLAGPGVNPTNDAGIWAGAPGALQLVAREGDTAPGTSGVFGPFNDQFAAYPVPVLSSSGAVAFGANFDGGRGVWRWSSGVSELVSRTGASAFGPGTTLDYLHEPWINSSGQVAFKASVVGDGVEFWNDAGVWAGVPGAIDLVARKGDPAPGAGGQYLALNSDNVGLTSIDDAGYVTFPSSCFDIDHVIIPNGGGIWRYGTLGSGAGIGNPVMVLGTAAPGAGGADFGGIQTLGPHPAGIVPFTAYLSGAGVNANNDESFWLKDVGNPLNLIAREGDQFDVGGGVLRTIGTISIAYSPVYESCLSPSRRLAIGLSFSGGTSGIFTADVPAPATPGDMNCDGAINAADVPHFSNALLAAPGFGGCDLNRADMNSDSAIDGRDAQPFIAALLTQP